MTFRGSISAAFFSEAINLSGLKISGCEYVSGSCSICLMQMSKCASRYVMRLSPDVRYHDSSLAKVKPVVYVILLEAMGHTYIRASSDIW